MGDLLIMSKKELKRKGILDRIICGELTQKDASIRLGLSYRQTKRIYQRYMKLGDEGLLHKSRGRASGRAFATDLKEKILSHYESNYLGFGPTLASEKLSEEGYLLSAETLRLWLKQAGLWHTQRKRREHRSRRARRRRFGELLQLDGSIHSWFSENETKQCLMNMVDDATSKTLALLATGETTEAAFQLLQNWIERHGIPMAIYVDLKSLYVSPKCLRAEDEELIEPHWLTHFSKACKELGIDVIKAYSPQAKGRVERSHGVYQDRFVKELKLKGIQTIEEANTLLQSGFIDNLNQKFMKRPESEEDAHIALLPHQDLKDILCWEFTRTVSNDWVIRFENQLFQIAKSEAKSIKPKQKLTVKKHMDGQLSLWANGQKVPYQIIDKTEVKTKIRQTKYYSSTHRSNLARKQKSKTPWSRYNTSWLNPKNEHVIQDY